MRYSDMVQRGTVHDDHGNIIMPPRFQTFVFAGHFLPRESAWGDRKLNESNLGSVLIMEGSVTGDEEMVPAEHALELVSVDKAWELLATLSTQVVHKQSELQVQSATVLCCSLPYCSAVPQ